MLTCLCAAGGNIRAQSAPATKPVTTAPLQASTTAVPATTQPLAAEEIPDPKSLKVTDKPGDNGSSIQVEWKRPVREGNVKYVIQVASSPQDFTDKKFKSKIVTTMPADSGDTYKTDLSPASEKFFPPMPMPKVDGDYFKKVAQSGAITQSQLERSLATFDLDKLLDKTKAAFGEVDGILSDVGVNFDDATVAIEKANDNNPIKNDYWEKTQKKFTAAQGDIEHAQEDLAIPNMAEVKVDIGQTIADIQTTMNYLTKAREELGEKTAPGAPELDSIAKGLSKAKDALSKMQVPSLTKEQESDLRWFHRLKTYLRTQDQKARDAAKAERNKQKWYVRLGVEKDDRTVFVGEAGTPEVLSAAGKEHVFKWFKLNNLIFSLVFAGIVVTFIAVAKRRPGLFIRKIGGLEAVDEAIGRSTEMDRKVFFVHGLGGVGDLATMASINILSRVAGRAAEHDTRVRVMNNDPIVMAVSQEVVKQAYTQAGRPDAYNADDISLVGADQFSYVAAVGGNMVREQPGAIFLMGSFAAESLLLAETGASTGAIQIAGTDAYTQIPFFITTCDYTLIGEELYAASAYLSREPRLLGSLRGQDVGKAFLMVTIVVVSIILTVAALWGFRCEQLRDFFKAFPG
jgi:hypothetical protein